MHYQYFQISGDLELETDQELATLPNIDSEKVTNLKLTFLVENSIFKSKLLAEHGLSVLCEGTTSRGTNFKYLFDTGPSRTGILNNINELKVDLKDLDAIIISHGHYDHTGGLLSILGRRFLKKVNVICHPDALTSKYAKMRNTLRNIGMPFDVERLRDNKKINLILKTEPHYLTKCIFTTGEVERLNDFEKVPERFRTIKNDIEQKDEILDDQALVFVLNSGLVILAGCSHAGVVNTINKAVSLTGIKKISALYGGFHLIGARIDTIQRTLIELKKFDIDLIGPCHCTGTYANHLIMGDFIDNYQLVTTGSEFIFE